MGASSTSHPSLNDPKAWVPYRYVPSEPAAIVAVAAFGLTTILHILQLLRKRTWYFLPLIIGGLFEIAGYISRIVSHHDIWALGPYIVQSILILVAPALFAASIYIILGRIILLVDGEQYSLIRRKWLTKVFVTGDILSFFVQGGGGGIQAMSTLSSLKLGNELIIVGLFLQVTFFGVFIVVAAVFHRRIIKSSSSKLSNRPISPVDRHDRSPRRMTGSSSAPIFSSHPHTGETLWRRHLYALYVASTLIMIRSVFRVIEYLMGNDGYLLRHEVFLYIFDALLMFLVMALFLFIHPSEITDLYKRRNVEGGGVELDPQEHSI